MRYELECLSLGKLLHKEIQDPSVQQATAAAAPASASLENYDPFRWVILDGAASFSPRDREEIVL